MRSISAARDLCSKNLQAAMPKGADFLLHQVLDQMFEHYFPSLDNYVEGIKEMTDIVGADHVSIGTDQFDARGCVEDYTRWVHLIAAMLRGGFTSEETRSPAAITCAFSVLWSVERVPV